MSCPKWAFAPLLILASVAVAVLGRVAFDRAVGPAPAFLIPFLFPVVVVASCAGTRWGLFATLLIAVNIAYFFTPPDFNFGIRDFEDQVRIGTFGVLGAVLSGFVGSLRGYKQQAEAHARALEREVAVRQDAEQLLEQRAGPAHNKSP